MLRQSLSTASRNTFAGPWEYSYISPCVRDEPYRLWQCIACERTEDYNWQAAEGFWTPELELKSFKFDRGLTHIFHNELNWLNVPQRVIFKLCTTVYKCLYGLAPQYLAELCVPVTDVPGRRYLRSTSCGLLGRYNLSNYGRRAFSHAGPYYWNSLPYNVRNSVSITSFKRALKHSCSVRIRIQRIRNNFIVWWAKIKKGDITQQHIAKCQCVVE